MDMQNYTTPFANTGDTEEFSIDTDPQGKVSLEKGWTELYQLRPEEGGLFILRKVFNQMMKLVSTDTVTWKTQSFPNWIDDKGDGLPFAYPKNAIVKYTNGNNYVSLVGNNTQVPTGANWKLFDITALDNTVKLTGNQTIAGVKTFSSTIGGSITGNAGSATKLATARTINGVAFDGTANINVLPARLGGSNAQMITDWNLAVENGWYMGDNALNTPPNTDWNLGIVEAHNHLWVTQTIHSFTTDSSSNSAVWRRQRNGGTWGDWYRLQLTQEEQDARYVKLTGNETISGVKTFSSSPIVPTPTTGTQAVNKDYADLKVALASFIGANQSLAINGYQKLPGGLIMQWGTMPYTSDNRNATITFPITFPTVCVSIVPSIDTVSNGAGNWSVYGKATAYFNANYSSTVSNSASGYYIAVGY